MVAGQAQIRMLSDQFDTSVGVSPVTDQITQAPQRVALSGLNLLQNRLKRLLVGVDVCDDRYPHGISCRADPVRACLLRAIERIVAELTVVTQRVAAAELGQALDVLACLPLRVVVLHRVDQFAHELR
jgi:hypothetical protein